MKRSSLRPAFVTVIVAAAVCEVASAQADPPPPRAAACPETEPARGAACGPVDLACGYMACGDYWTHNAVCQGSPPRWQIVEATCNPPPPPIVAPQMPTANPPPPAPPPTAGPPLRPGRHACAFVEGADRYARQCIVTRLPDSTLRVVASGTRLNPTNGFNITLSGAASPYHVQGSLSAFGACSGTVTGTLAHEGAGRSRAFRVRWGQCAIEIKP